LSEWLHKYLAVHVFHHCCQADVPLVDDPVSKIDHIGRETVRKLADMRTAALEAGVDAKLLTNSMTRIDTGGWDGRTVTHRVHCVDDPFHARCQLGQLGQLKALQVSVCPAGAGGAVGSLDGAWQLASRRCW
jgi:hypothetical protein